MSFDMKTTGSSNLDMSHPVISSEDRDAWRALLDWHAALGVDEVIGDVPVNAFERKDPDLSSFSALASHGDVPRPQDVVSSTQVSSPASSGPASSGPASSGLHPRAPHPRALHPRGCHMGTRVRCM